jgi:hypothetical protein
MTLEIDRTLSQLCEEREDLRVQISLATDVPRPDTRQLLTGRAKLILLEAEIVARRRLLARAQTSRKRRAAKVPNGNHPIPNSLKASYRP